MSNTHRGGGRRGFRNKIKNKQEFINVETSNPFIVAAFRNYSQELDDKHDRYERIIKISRDITIESKRIIFLLHTMDTKKKNQDIVLEEAEKRLQALSDTHFLLIAKELGNLDPYQYARSYSAGLQEFIEAYSFYEFLKGRPLSDWNVLQKNLNYTMMKSKTDCDNTKQDKIVNEIITDEDKNEINRNNAVTKKKDIRTSDTEVKLKSCFIQPTEYMLGLGDLTGEIMRRCINSLGSGDIDPCFQSCQLLQAFYTGFIGLNVVRYKDLNRKIYTLRQSVLKTENVCYNVKVRGGEAAIWGSVNDPFCIGDNRNDDIDEGYY